MLTQTTDGHNAACACFAADAFPASAAAYLRSLLDVVILTAGAHGWSLTGFPRDELVAAVAADGYERDVVAHCLDIFGPPQAPAGGMWSLDARAVCIARARGLLSTTPRWRLDDFMTAWRASCPEARLPRCIDDACSSVRLN